MRLTAQNRDKATVELTIKELEIINNALNEVCHGLDVQEFSVRIGAEKREVLKLLHEVGSAAHR